MVTAKDDTELMLDCQAGDWSAFRILLERCEVRLINYIYRMVGDIDEAEDLFQETFLKVLENRTNYRPTAKFSTWLYTIARNLCLNWLKRQEISKRVVASAPQQPQVSESPSSSGDSPESEELEYKLKTAIRELPEKLHEALVLRFYADLSYKEISELMSAPIGTVNYWVQEAIKKLAARFGSGITPTG